MWWIEGINVRINSLIQRTHFANPINSDLILRNVRHLGVAYSPPEETSQEQIEAPGDWGGLILFLTDGRIEMDSDAVERTIRSIALQRKNTLFAGAQRMAGGSPFSSFSPTSGRWSATPSWVSVSLTAWLVASRMSCICMRGSGNVRAHLISSLKRTRERIRSKRSTAFWNCEGSFVQVPAVPWRHANRGNYCHCPGLQVCRSPALVPPVTNLCASGGNPR